MPCQEVFNKISLDRIPDELKDLKKLKKKKNSKRIFKKIAIMHGKDELRVVFVISPLKQKVCAIFCQDCRFKRID